MKSTTRNSGPASRTPTPQTATVRRSALADRSTSTALIATFAALIAACSLLTGPAVSGVPITLQTFAVLLAGVVLGPWRGAGAVLLYIAVGLAGLPVFAGGKSGVVMLAGPTVGYLIAFPLAAALAGWWIHRARAGQWRALAAHAGLAVAAATIVIYSIGVPVLSARVGIPLSKAFLGNLVYLPLDAVKAALAAIVGLSVLRAFPQLARAK
ncbi:biotin transporter BioY [Rarobacter incanus]|uniref:Biotin transporter n=1 Tax=Rarobacter incanus TaxID=153494 RepID=A0A542SMH1_9MICO|nr:biotin transporter BioY [Rarobacter incanus]TQK75822.1 biotin transport system substrate-specific component [Rarobacter incanus]